MTARHLRNRPDESGLSTGEAKMRSEAEESNHAYMKRINRLILTHAERARVSMAMAAVMLANGRVPR